MAISSKKTRYGTVFRSSTCKDDFRNIRTRSRRRKNGSVIPFTTITLQGPALKSLRAVEEEISGRWIKRYVRVTGSHRTCAFQLAKWRSDPSRFAHPNVGLHTQGLAIDVHTAFLTKKLKAALLKHGWSQSRPTDEPWHFSYGWTA